MSEKIKDVLGNYLYRYHSMFADGLDKIEDETEAFQLATEFEFLMTSSGLGNPSKDPIILKYQLSMVEKQVRQSYAMMIMTKEQEDLLKKNKQIKIECNIDGKVIEIELRVVGV